MNSERLTDELMALAQRTVKDFLKTVEKNTDPEDKEPREAYIIKTAITGKVFLAYLQQEMVSQLKKQAAQV